MTTIFGKILKGELPCTKVYENEHVLAFKDIYPQAPVHILIIPKKEISCLQAVEKKDFFLITEMIYAAQVIAKNFGIEDNYRLVTNNGEDAGQEIFHFHFHLIGGASLGPLC
ncbi:MAG: histidine triad nucleotide-binding protein [Chlamydiales bacterium]|nr:histidine triad nucleotide-binding protein [Chlamydiales bacterium]